MAFSIKSMLDQFIQNDNDWRIRVIKKWPEIMGRLQDKVGVEKVHKKTLYLVTYDSCWLTELHMLSRFIIKNVNEALGTHEIEKVHFSLKTKKQAKECIIKKQEPLMHYVYQLSSKEQLVLSKIKDTHLKQALEGFLKRCKHELK